MHLPQVFAIVEQGSRFNDEQSGADEQSISLNSLEKKIVVCWI
jgi:hypothetical protein